LESEKYNLRVYSIERIGVMQRKKCFLIAVLLFLLTGFFAFFQTMKVSSNASATSVYPPPQVDWVRTFGGVGNQCAYAVEQESDGGYLLFGNSYLTESSESRIVKTDSEGNVLWDKTLWLVGSAVHQTEDNGHVIVGGNKLVRIDQDANELWNRTYEVEDNQPFFFAVSHTNDGGYVLGGKVHLPPVLDDYDFCLVKVGGNGTVEWSRTYGVDMTYEVVTSVEQASDGGYVLAGYTTPHTGNPVGIDSWVGKTDENGNMVWNATYGKSGIRDQFNVVQRTGGDGIILAGCWGSSLRLVKMNINASYEWERQYGDSGQIIEFPESYSVRQTDDGGFIAIGRYGSEIWLIRTDLSGNMLWSTTCGRDLALSVIQTADKGYAVAGRSPWISTDNSYDFLLVKIVPDEPLTARFRYSPTKPIANEKITFNASYSYDRNQDIASYLWNFDDGNITSIMNPIVVHRYENPGIYNVSLRVVDAEGLNSIYSLVLCAKIPTSISISTSTPSATAGYSVSISGTLLDLYGNRIGNETVDLYYAYSGYEDWNAIASEFTDIFGNFSAAWIPPAPSYFVLKAVYAGNYTHVESSRNVTVSILPYGETYLFSVESNSTVSSMGFDTTNQTLSFTATGADGTKGYAKVTAAKSLVPNLALLSVHVDGAEYNYTVTDADDSWVLLFAYDHSAHLVEIRLDSTIPEFPSLLVVTLFMIGTVLAVIAYKKRAKSTKVPF